MKNLEQIRAAHAWDHRTGLKQSDVNGLPPMILNNGLLATAAFAAVVNDQQQAKRPGMKKAMDALAGHLAANRLLAAGKGTVTGLLEDLPKRTDAMPLQRATAEALAYLSYLKRFASPDKEEGR